MVVRLDKKKIFLLYQYYLLGEINQVGVKEETVNWFNSKFSTQENLLQEKVTHHLKSDWEFSRLPPLEKAILVYGAYELLFEQKSHHKNLVINNVINFSKAYLEREKTGYINKILDLVAKEKKNES